MGHGHHHHGPGGHGARENRRRLSWVLGLVSIYLVVEVAGGVLTGSLALLADAGHMLTDVVGIGLALVAMKVSERLPTPERTYGYFTKPGSASGIPPPCRAASCWRSRSGGWPSTWRASSS